MGTLFDFDFAPLWRSTIAFDRLFDMLEQRVQVEPAYNFPPYNIEKTGDETYRVSLAVASFTPDELSVAYQPGLLVVSGNKAESQGGEYLYHGMANGSFERRFNLAEYVEVSGARLVNGMLIIELARELPEAMKPRRISIASDRLQAIKHQQAA
jgi:molecular chaperone IbpA